MNFIDHPIKISMNEYKRAIQSKVESLSNINEITSIYQLGNIKNPGISDIDLLVIFKDNFLFTSNPLNNSSRIENYIFTHNLFGLSDKYFNDAAQYTFFSNPKYLKIMLPL